MQIAPLPSLSILFSIIFHFPYIFADISKYHHIYLMTAQCLIVTSLVSSGLDFSECLFYFFIQQNTISLLKDRSPIVILLLSLESIFIFNSDHLTHLSIAFIAFCFVGQFAIYIVFPSEFHNLQFPSKTMIFGMLIDLCCGVKVKPFLFLIAVVLYPVSNFTYTSIYRFTRENLFSFIYLIVSFTMNIYGIMSGIKLGAGPLIISSELSLYNTISLMIVLFGEIIAREPISKEFSYGKGRIKYVFQLTSSIIILYSAFFLLVDNTTSCFMDSIYVRDPSRVVLLSLVDFGISLFGAISIGNAALTSFSLMCDIFISSSALISSLFDYLFNFPSFDIVISYFIIVTIFITTVSELRDSLYALMLCSSRKLFAKTLNAFNLSYRTTVFHYWSTGSQRNVINIKTQVSRSNNKTSLKAMKQYFRKKGIESTIELHYND
ncbi:cation efflux family protein [Trichomonas vaginalis G3]|uniref:Cation efflux family protein n=1 Tax=Trichomonas vaginalis (strain ATCC PRA-98 / G3) TaxID=412133 RepID=A2D920_TRIV3|nr:cation efflux family [Trichomonas vaginalis G3]EAY23046.1 cation efflux family protein [Trichomonas vaginalis G3]KAI5519015.1 cation efflux family [Trichomonas vaginalis G3]|eukprot:XP_001584032.1 cation efflux family protein [Trichomonas vaginalis G3]